MRNDSLLVFAVGLPGCGKTTFLKKYAQKQDIKYYDFDNIQCVNSSQLSRINTILSQYDGIVIDTLLLTTDQIIFFLDQLKLAYVSEFEIHYWKPNREMCVYNDQYRRTEGSHIVIKNANIEEPDIIRLRQKYIDKKITIIYHNSVRKEVWQLFAHKYQLGEQRYITSKRWITGGQWGNCWGVSGSMNTEPQPECKLLDSILEKICSNITYLQYKDIYRSCVSIESGCEHGYYGSYEEYSYYKLDVLKLYNKLVELFVISNMEEEDYV